MAVKRQRIVDEERTDPQVPTAPHSYKTEDVNTSFGSEIFSEEDKPLQVTRSQYKRKRVSDSTGPTAELPAEAQLQPRSASMASSSLAVVTENVKVAQKFVKHSKYWLLDGNTLVQIGETRFKLHRSILVEHSEWFRRVIEGPPHERCLRIDETTGARVYCLDALDIHVEDFVTLLDAIHGATIFVFEGPSFRTVASILRVSDALEFTKFRQYAIKYLERNWPTDVNSVGDTRLKYAMEAISVAHKCGVTSILKRAYYELVRSDEFLQEIGEEDMQVDGKEAHRGRCTLDDKDYRILLRAREFLTTAWMRKAAPPKRMFQSNHKHAAANCAVTSDLLYKIYVRIVHRSRIFEKFKYDPILGLTALIGAPWGTGGKWTSTYGKNEQTLSLSGFLCSACSTKLIDILIEDKQKLWNDLDFFFELPADQSQEEVEETEGVK